MLALVVPDSGWYQLTLVLHILVAGGGFGMLVQRHQSRWTEPLLWALPVLGLLLVLLSEDRWQFSQAWIAISFPLYLGALLAHHARLRCRGRAAAAWNGIFNSALVVIVAVMVIKPGA